LAKVWEKSSGRLKKSGEKNLQPKGRKFTIEGVPRREERGKQRGDRGPQFISKISIGEKPA